MQQTQPSSFRFLAAIGDAMRQPDLRWKLLFTFGILVIFRFVANVPVPGVDLGLLDRAFQDNQLLGFLNIFSGGALQNLSVASMGVYPYITASIIMQLLVPVIPRLQAISREGEYGRQKINQYTHWLTIPLAMAQGYGQLILLQRSGVITGIGLGEAELFSTISMVLSLTAGTMFLVWLGELITEKGIGNGISLIIFGGIVASLPRLIDQNFIQEGVTAGILFTAIAGLLVVYAIVSLTRPKGGYPSSTVVACSAGGRMYRQAGSSFIPIRVNSAGMIPLIFAFSIMIFPGIMASYFVGVESSSLSSFARTIQDIFHPNNWVYWFMTFVLVVTFTFFYTLVIFQQQNLAENLQKNGGFIPGIRPATNVGISQRVILR